MFERFTERSRQVVVLAEVEARRAGHDHIGTEHLLAGLLHEEEGLAAQALASLGVTIERVRATMREGHEAPEQLPFSNAAEKALEYALREALALGHNYVGTEHILLGLVREEGTCVPEIRGTLSDLLDGDLQSVRDEVMRLLSGPTPKKKREDEETKQPFFAKAAKTQEQRIEDALSVILTSGIPVNRSSASMRTLVEKILRAADAPSKPKWPTEETLEALQHCCNIEGKPDQDQVRDALLTDPIIKAAIIVRDDGVNNVGRLFDAVDEAGL